MSEVEDIKQFLRQIDPHIARFKKILADMEPFKTSASGGGFKNERIQNLSNICEAFLAKKKEVRRLQDEGVSSEDSPFLDECFVELIKLRSEYEAAGTSLSNEEREFCGNVICLGLYFGASIPDCLDQLAFLNPSFIPDMENMLRVAAVVDPLAPVISSSMKEMSALGKTLPPDELQKLYLENPDMQARNEKEGEIVDSDIMKNVERMSQKGVRALVLKAPPIQTFMTLNIILTMAQLAILFEEKK